MSNVEKLFRYDPSSGLYKEVSNNDELKKVELYWYDDEDRSFKPLISDGEIESEPLKLAVENIVDLKVVNLDSERLPIVNESENTIIVSTKEDCDYLEATMLGVTNSTINVAFRGGKHTLNKLNIDSRFNGKVINFYNVSGEKPILLPDSDTYTPSDALETNETHYICDLKREYLGNNTLITNTGVIKVCDSRNVNNDKLYLNDQTNVELYDSQNKIYRIKLTEELSHLNNEDISDFKTLFLWSAYLMFPNKITDISDGYVYFENTQYGFPNLDRSYIGVSARYYITNIEEYLTEDTFLVKDDKLYIPKKCKYAIMANNNTIFNITSSNVKVNFSGLEFNGGRSNYLKMYDSTIYIKDVDGININHCKFNNLENQAILIETTGNGNNIPYVTKNIKIKDSIFSNTGNGCVDFLGENITIVNSKFTNIGEFRKGCEVVFGGGKNFNVSDNELFHFYYVGLRVGKPGATRHHNSGTYTRNIVNGNFTNSGDDYMTDGGGIYVFTYNVDVNIKDNVIFNIDGHDMRGIMGDDGNNNTNYERNLVFNIIGKGASRGIDCGNTLSGSSENHLNNKFKNNLVIGRPIVFGSTNSSNTKTEENVVTDHAEYRGSGVNVVKKDYYVNYFRTDDTTIYLDNKITIPFDLPEVFKSYLKFEDSVVKYSNKGTVSTLINSTNKEINNGNFITSTNNMALQKYEVMNMNVQMLRSFQNSALGQYSNLNIKLPYYLGNFTDNNYINFKVNLFTDRAIFRNSFEVTLSSYKPDISTYQNLLMEINNVKPKSNSSNISIKLTPYVDIDGSFNIRLEPLIENDTFISSVLIYLEICDVKVNNNNPLDGREGVISINKDISNIIRSFGTFAILSDKAPKSHVQQSITYPDSTMVYLTDTNQLVWRKNNSWQVISNTTLT